MHNDGVNRRPVACAALLTAATLALAGCGGGSSSTPGAGSSGTSGSSRYDDLDHRWVELDRARGHRAGRHPDGARATKLKVGDSAKVSWHPNQKTTGVLKVSVTKLQKEPITVFKDWQLDPATQKSTPYFVHATVRNLGKAPLSGCRCRSTCSTAATPCSRPRRSAPSSPPARARPCRRSSPAGKKTSVCLVYFAPDHGKLVAVSFRPTQDFDAITWTGPLAKPKK